MDWVHDAYPKLESNDQPPKKFQLASEAFYYYDEGWWEERKWQSSSIKKMEILLCSDWCK